MDLRQKSDPEKFRIYSAGYYNNLNGIILNPTYNN